MHRSVGRGVPGISATAPVTIGEGSITGGWGGDFEIDYWSLVPAGVRVSCVAPLVLYPVTQVQHMVQQQAYRKFPTCLWKMKIQFAVRTSTLTTSPARRHKPSC
jgi:hypothetical protein